MVRPCVARGFVDLADVVLHQCIGPLIGALLPAIMDISARAISLADRPQWAIWVTRVRMRREDRSSISSHPLADLGGVEASGLPHRVLIGPLPGFSSPQSSDDEQERSRRCAPACWRARWRARCGAACFLAASSQGLSPRRSQLFGLISTTHAAWT